MARKFVNVNRDKKGNKTENLSNLIENDTKTGGWLKKHKLRKYRK